MQPKSISELQLYLLSDICNSLHVINDSRELDCYNDILGYTSHTLALILNRYFPYSVFWRSSGNWFDDGHIHKIVHKDCKLRMWGVMIWGTGGTTEQWVDPFYTQFMIDCENEKLEKFLFLFGQHEYFGEITYSDFMSDPGIWDRDYYTTDEWDPEERDWKFKVYAK